MTPPRSVLATLLVLVAGVGLVACGEQNAQEPTSTGGSESMSTPTPSEDPLEDLTVAPSGKSGGWMRLVGTVSAGVEGGCHLLTSGGTTYQLVGGGRDVVDGQRVQVEGTVRRDMVTTCQEGVPFLVERVVSGTTP
jgi:hypothetical protein